ACFSPRRIGGRSSRTGMKDLGTSMGEGRASCSNQAWPRKRHPWRILHARPTLRSRAGPSRTRRAAHVLDSAPVKIYTRTGDDGSTGLLGPGRVLKSAPRVEAYGAIDELNAGLGIVRSLDRDRWLADPLGPIQSQLFNLGAELATTTPAMLEKLERLGESEVASLEQWIDRLEKDLSPLTSFILPG